ncbi:MAG: Rieske 2Fe-2S domain-containing protein [Xanthomonadales bacterium]|nr:Rieske 2Fe-2S domain-containing protein [Xanthomonadales bacterium]
MSDDYLPVIKADEIPLNGFRCVDAGEYAIVICHTREGYFALENRCSHARARFDDGRLRGTRLMCPLHGAAFDVRTGAGTKPARWPVATFPCRVSDDGVIEVQVSEEFIAAARPVRPM